MPFERSNTDNQKRKDRDSESEGKRRRSSLENNAWTPSQSAVLRRFLGLEKANCWFPLTLDKSWIEDHMHVPTLHMVMDVDLSRFKTIVLEFPGQLWTGNGTTWKNVCQYIGFSWAAECQSHLVVQGADSKGHSITWINCYRNHICCPLDVLNSLQPGLHCMRWRRRLGNIGCLEP